MFPKSHKEFILASSSDSRRSILEAAGINFRIVSPEIDEGAIMESLAGEDMTLSDMAELLARTKAEAVSSMHEGAWVIGGDQVLSFQGRIFTKPDDLDEARDRLLALRGETHVLHSAVAVAVAGETRWARVETAHMGGFNPCPAGLARHRYRNRRMKNMRFTAQRQQSIPGFIKVIRFGKYPALKR